MTRHLEIGASTKKWRPMNRPARVFLSYAQEDVKLRDELEKHLAGLRRSGHVLVWHDRMIGPGRDRSGAIDAQLEAADIILLLVSSSFLASDYCFEVEVAKALERHRNGQARIIPVLVRDCDWTGAPFGHLQAVPYEPGAGAKPVTAWSDHDAAWASVARALRSLLESGSDTKTKPRTYAALGLLLAGLAAAGVALLIGINGNKDGGESGGNAPPSGPTDDARPTSSQTVTTAPVSAPGSAMDAPPRADGAGKPPAATAAATEATAAAPSGAVTSPTPATAAPPGLATATSGRSSSATAAAAAPRGGTATLSGAFWSLGVASSELNGAAFVCLDPAPRPPALAGVQPTCSVLAGSSVAQCSRSDVAREVPIGTSARWRLPCP